MPKPTEDSLPTRPSLLRRVRNWNDQAGWQEFYNTYKRIVFVVAIKSGLSEAEAEDVVQEALTQAYLRISTFRHEGGFYTWLYRIATNVFLNHVRRPRPVVQLEEEHVAAVPAPTRRQDDEASDRELSELLRHAVVRLPDEQRFAIVAYYWGEARVHDIARVEGVSEVAIRKRMKRAFRALRLALGEVPS